MKKLIIYSLLYSLAWCIVHMPIHVLSNNQPSLLIQAFHEIKSDSIHFYNLLKAQRKIAYAPVRAGTGTMFGIINYFWIKKQPRLNYNLPPQSQPQEKSMYPMQVSMLELIKVDEDCTNEEEQSIDPKVMVMPIIPIKRTKLERWVQNILTSWKSQKCNTLQIPVSQIDLIAKKLSLQARPAKIEAQVIYGCSPFQENIDNMAQFTRMLINNNVIDESTFKVISPDHAIVIPLDSMLNNENSCDIIWIAFLLHAINKNTVYLQVSDRQIFCNTIDKFKDLVVKKHVFSSAQASSKLRNDLDFLINYLKKNVITHVQQISNHYFSNQSSTFHCFKYDATTQKMDNCL